MFLQITKNPQNISKTRRRFEEEFLHGSWTRAWPSQGQGCGYQNQHQQINLNMMPLSFKRAVLSSSVWWGWFKKCWRDKSEPRNYGALFFSVIRRLTNDKSKQKEHAHARPELKNDLWRRKTAGGGGARWDWLKFASCQKKGRVINLVFKPRFNIFIVDKSINLHIAATYFINSTGSNVCAECTLQPN